MSFTVHQLNLTTFMTKHQTGRLFLVAPFAGVLSIISYMIVAFGHLPLPLDFLLAMAFPILGIFAVYGIKEFVNQLLPSWTNSLGFVFGCSAYLILAIFLSAQMAVHNAVVIDDFNGAEETARYIKRAVRTIDMGIDVAWDMFIGTYLILFGLSTNRISFLRLWGMIGALLGTALIILNSFTFPWPPGDKGLVDLGPFIAVYLLALYFRLAIAGSRLIRRTIYHSQSDQ